MSRRKSHAKRWLRNLEDPDKSISPNKRSRPNPRFSRPSDLTMQQQRERNLRTWCPAMVSPSTPKSTRSVGSLSTDCWHSSDNEMDWQRKCTSTFGNLLQVKTHYHRKALRSVQRQKVRNPTFGLINKPANISRRKRFLEEHEKTRQLCSSLSSSNCHQLDEDKLERSKKRIIKELNKFIKYRLLQGVRKHGIP